METKDNIEKILRRHINIISVTIMDDSDKHAGHAESVKSGGGHFSIEIISDDFNGKSLIERHKMVYSALKNNMKTSIHALAIKTLTPQENT